jgi:hypothetical protein
MPNMLPATYPLLLLLQLAITAALHQRWHISAALQLACTAAAGLQITSRHIPLTMVLGRRGSMHGARHGCCC